VSNVTEIETSQAEKVAPRTGDAAVSVSDPTPDELRMLAPMERFAFRVSHRMNQGAAKRFWTFCQRTIGATWIRLATYNLMQVYGIDNLNRASHERPILLVANHRSFFDMYVVASALFRRTRWRKKLFFPVRSTFFYDSLLGMFVNFVMGWWSMYPPFFSHGGKRDFDDFTMRRLTDLCRTGAGNVIGFHPEGKRNLSPDPYTLLRAQPGIGKVVKDAAPQVVPVFVTGLGNNLYRQIKSNWTGGEKIRIHFGEPIDLSAYLTRRDSMRTYKEITDFVMSKISQLGECDRAMQHTAVRAVTDATEGKQTASSASAPPSVQHRPTATQNESS